MGIEKETKKFAAAYEEQEQELLILTSEAVGGAGRAAGETAWTATAGFLASVDLTTGEMKEEMGCLRWLAREEDRDGWIYHLKPLTIYHVKCRAKRRKKHEKEKSGDESCARTEGYMLTEVVDRGLQHLGLEKVLEEYQKVVELKDETCGSFTLDRLMDWFSTEMDWLGEKCDVHLQCDEEEGETAEKALAYFKEIYGSLQEWDKELRTFAAKQLTSLANDWLADMMEEEEDLEEDLEEMEECDEEDAEDLDADALDEEDWNEELEEITEADFAKRIQITSLVMEPEGDYSVYYNDDDMFWGHSVIVEGNVETGMERAYIAG